MLMVEHFNQSLSATHCRTKAISWVHFLAANVHAPYQELCSLLRRYLG